MGYDNTVHLVSIHETHASSNDFKRQLKFAECLMTIELRGMATDFEKLFENKQTDFVFYGIGGLSNGNKGYDDKYTDPYGDKLSYTTDIKKVIEWLKADMEKSKAEYNGKPYRRDTMLYNILKNFKMYDWRGTTIALVHEGH